MTPQNMNLAEAYQAIERGEWVQDVDGCEYAHGLINGKLHYQKTTGEIEETETCFDAWDWEYKIVPNPTKPTPKRLSFEEAVELLRQGKVIKAHPSEGASSANTWRFIVPDDLVNLASLMAAEKADWDILEVES